jgi:hypothetical protein
MKKKSIYHHIITSSHYLIFFAFCFLILGCGNKNAELSVANINNPLSADGMDEQQKANLPDLHFDELSYDFGKVIQGEVLSYTFYFKNI